MRFDRSYMSVLVLGLGGCAAIDPISVDQPTLFAEQDAESPVSGAENTSPISQGPSVTDASYLTASVGSNPTVMDTSNPIALDPAPLVAGPPSPVAEGSDGAAGQWEFVLNGSGASDKKFEAGGFSATASLGFYLSDHFELAVRQSILFADSDAGASATNASTLAALDIVFGSGSFRPFLGASAGRIYGNAVHETWVGGPEGGFKIYLKKDVFLQLLAQYQYFFENGDAIDDQFDNGSFVYALGFGVNF